ncbi:hypothetical protein [Kitasatospora sp. NPDC059571]|uniref:hypothetical protein n=1 Tax=Kitasatospora sp. NPDC059571 TaxID=3346871 RepID=UPI0036896DB2
MSLRTRCLVVCLLMLLAACGTAPSGARAARGGSGGPSPTTTQGASVPPTTDPASPPPQPGAVPAPAPAPAVPTSAQLAGRRIVWSYPGPTPPEALLDAVREGRAAGVIFFGENTADPAALHSAVAALGAAQRESGVRSPLLLMTDGEGGV